MSTAAAAVSINAALAAQVAALKEERNTLTRQNENLALQIVALNVDRSALARQKDDLAVSLSSLMNNEQNKPLAAQRVPPQSHSKAEDDDGDEFEPAPWPHPLAAHQVARDLAWKTSGSKAPIIYATRLIVYIACDYFRL